MADSKNTKINNIDLELSFKPDKAETISKLQREIIEEDLKQFEPIKENDINISTSFVFDMGDKLEASVFFRNGLSNKINFDKLPIVLLDGEGKEVAREVFTLRDLGDIPPKSARPWKLYFNKENIVEMPKDVASCKVVFSKEIKALSTLDVEFENMPSDDVIIQKNLQEYLKSLPLLEKGQITLNTYEINLQNNNAISIIIVVRNGTRDKIRLEKIPVTVYDGQNKKICSVTFNIKDLEVSAQKAKMYKLMLEFEDEEYLEYDLQGLSVKFVNE